MRKFYKKGSSVPKRLINVPNKRFHKYIKFGADVYQTGKKFIMLGDGDCMVFIGLEKSKRRRNQVINIPKMIVSGVNLDCERIGTGKAYFRGHGLRIELG